MKKSAVPSLTAVRRAEKVWRGMTSKGAVDVAAEGDGEEVFEGGEESQWCSSARTKPITYEPLLFFSVGEKKTRLDERGARVRGMS